MNVENIRKLIAWIKEDNAHHFRMSSITEFLDPDTVPDDAKDNNEEPIKYVHCNTAFCIAGYANLLRIEEDGVSREDIINLADAVDDMQAAAKWLGIDREKAWDLFHLGGSGIMFREFDSYDDELKAKAAVAVLENLIKTGEANWKLALERAGISY